MAETRLRRLVPVGVCIFALSGCASLDKYECLNADWRTLGYEDGARGKVADVIGNYRKDCAEHGVAPDLDAYTAGRDEGLLEYCREANGFRLGYGGKIYQGVCPEDLEYDFKVGYRDGRELYELNAAVRSAEREIENRKTSLDGLQEELAEAEAELISDGVPTKRRAELLQKTRDIAAQIGATQSDISGLETDLAAKRSKLEALRKASPYL